MGPSGRAVRAPRSPAGGAEAPTFTTAPPGPVYDDLYGDPYGAGYEDGYDTAHLATVYGDVPPGPGFETHGNYGDLEQEDLDDEEEPGRRGWTRLLLVVGIIVGVLLALFAVIGLWVSRQINPSGSPGEAVTVDLTSGMSTPEIAQELADKDVVTDARIFTYYARFRGDGDIRAGTYESLRTNMAMGDVLDVLAEGPDWGEGEALLLPGRTVDEMMTLLGERVSFFDEAALQAAVAEVELQHLPDGEDNPEGLLAPGTYDLEDTTEADFVQMMADRFDELYEELEVDRRAGELDIGGDVELSGYDIVIVASMIERETAHGPEKAQIARVIYNRLAEGRALGIDATSCYEKEGECLPLSDEDLQGEYGTRNEPGLPPTPIASPSQESLEAALDPAEGAWDHYVLDVEAGDGSHVITDDQEIWETARQACVEAGECG